MDECLQRLRPNALAEWELRLGKFRVFYDVDEQAATVKVEAIGTKEGSTLFIHGEEYELLPPSPSHDGNGP